MRDVDYDKWTDYLLEIAKRFETPLSYAIDCACGTGAITTRMAKKGVKMVGIDISEEMLAEAQANARNNAVSIMFAKMDMQKFEVHKQADAVISACDGVNYLATLSELKRFFECAYRALKPNGLLMFDISSRHKLQKILGNSTFAADEGDIAYIWQNAYDSSSKLIEMNLSFFKKDGEKYEKFTEKHIQRAHSEKEIKIALCSAGFNEIYSYEAFSFDAPNKTSERIQFVAKRL
jgi:ubiquinone/menaquinone biosynthesis C-methylase UbiE